MAGKGAELAEKGAADALKLGEKGAAEAAKVAEEMTDALKLPKVLQKPAPLPKGVVENRQPYNVFEEEAKLKSIETAARHARDIHKAKHEAARLAGKVTDSVAATKLGRIAENSLLGQVAGAGYSEINALIAKRAKKKRKKSRATSSFAEQLREVVGLGPKAPDSEWVQLKMNRGEESLDAGWVLLSIELLPRTLANELVRARVRVRRGCGRAG